MDENSRRDWAGYDPTAIPSKAHFPELERWLDGLGPTSGQRILDLGCGAGVVSRLLIRLGYDVVGVDINAAAIAMLRSELPMRCHVRDIASEAFALDESPFDAVVCQLVASVVGDARDREHLFLNARAMLRPGGALFASFSGLSDDLNPEYAALYARDLTATGEHGTYLSRAADGRLLYRTHHFGREEIATLLQRAGFTIVHIEERRETSSRRPDQRARFFYVSAL
jgi:2-polyprenyl-3-methyl-5-hydroxy-6-metoxy-1,4-benzoquinol methylase